MNPSLPFDRRTPSAAVPAPDNGSARTAPELRPSLDELVSRSETLLRGPLSPEVRAQVEAIAECARTAVASLDAGLGRDGEGVRADRLDFDLRVTLDQLAASLEPMAIEKGLEWELRVGAIVPSRVQGDPARLRQVLMLLGTHALQATPRGRVGLVVERESEDDHEVVVRFAVCHSSTGTLSGADPWLGLEVSRRLIATMGGHLGTAADAAGECSAWFTLALRKQDPRDVVVPAAVQDVPLRGVRVLLADADAAERAPLAEVLEAWGCTVAHAENGPEALRTLQAGAANGTPFDVALVDRQLELLDGEELGRAVRADGALDAVRLAMLTRVGRAGDAARVKAAGFDAYLLKPVAASQLHEALVEVLQPGHAERAPEARPLVTRHSLAEARRGRVRILLVEDDPVNQLVTSSALHRVGYNVEVVDTPVAALERTERERWDLILMNLQLPGMGGERLATAIRARERGSRRTPIVGLSADAGSTAGPAVDTVLHKPVRFDLLAETVGRYTGAGRRSAGGPSPARTTVVSTRFEPAATRAGAPSGGPAIDLEQLETSCMGIPALRASLLQTWLGDVGSRLERLAQAFVEGDARRVEFEAHGIKGMSATIGATGCAALFGEVESRARDGRMTAAHDLLPSGRAEVLRTEEFIRRFERIVSAPDSAADAA